MKKDMVFLFIVLGGFFVSCTSGFREFNTDLAGVTDEDLKNFDKYQGMPLGIESADVNTWNKVCNGPLIFCSP